MCVFSVLIIYPEIKVQWLIFFLKMANGKINYFFDLSIDTLETKYGPCGKKRNEAPAFFRVLVDPLDWDTHACMLYCLLMTIYVWVHPYTHTVSHVYVHAQTCECAPTRTCHGYIHMCMPGCTSLPLHARATDAHICTCIHIHMSAPLHAHHTYTHTFTCTCIWVCTYTHIARKCTRTYEWAPTRTRHVYICI